MSDKAEEPGAEDTRRSSALRMRYNVGPFHVEWDPSRRRYVVTLPDGHHVCMSYSRREHGQMRETDVEHALGVAAALERIYSRSPTGGGQCGVE